MAQRLISVVESRLMLLLGLFFLVLWVTPITRLVYHPKAIEIEGTKVTMYRSFPGDALGLPRPKLSYVEIIRPLTPSHNGGQSCTDTGGPFRYTRSTEVGEWSIEWAAACLNDPVGYSWYARWYWHVGALKLGPTSLATTIFHSSTKEK